MADHGVDKSFAGWGTPSPPRKNPARQCADYFEAHIMQSTLQKKFGRIGISTSCLEKVNQQHWRHFLLKCCTELFNQQTDRLNIKKKKNVCLMVLINVCPTVGKMPICPTFFYSVSNITEWQQWFDDRELYSSCLMKIATLCGLDCCHRQPHKAVYWRQQLSVALIAVIGNHIKLSTEDSNFVWLWLLS